MELKAQGFFANLQMAIHSTSALIVMFLAVRSIVECIYSPSWCECPVIMKISMRTNWYQSLGKWMSVNY